MNTLPPKNGLLSGMIITGLAAVAAVLAGLLSPDAVALFNRPVPTGLLDVFFASILVMVAHKAESYFTHEYNVCPVYLASAHAPWGSNPRASLFAGFVGTFLGMMFLVYAVMRGGPWPLLCLGIWAAQGLHELHHAAKSLAQGSYYAGTVTGLIFVAVMALLFWPAWSGALGLAPVWSTIYAAAHPVIFAAFWVEHRGWLAKGGAAARAAVQAPA